MTCRRFRNMRAVRALGEHLGPNSHRADGNTEAQRGRRLVQGRVASRVIRPGTRAQFKRPASASCLCGNLKVAFFTCFLEVPLSLPLRATSNVYSLVSALPLVFSSKRHIFHNLGPHLLILHPSTVKGEASGRVRFTGRAQRSSSHASHWSVFQAHPVSCPCHSPSHVLWAKLSPLTRPQHFPTTHTLAELP